MMGLQQSQKELFSYQVNLDNRVRADHPLRTIDSMIDFTFVRRKVTRCYGYNGNVSVDPVVVMKMMFLLFYDNVRSERELMNMIPERLDYLWFLGYGLDDTVPDHSVLSKARARWGKEVFEELFVRVVWQCVEAGLVEGSKIYIDASLVDANASKNSVVTGSPEMIEALKRVCRKEEEKFEDTEEKSSEDRTLNRGMMSTTDPDAAIVRHGQGDSRPRYKHHRAIDEAHGVITAVETTSGDVEENARLMGLIAQHEDNTRNGVEAVVADVQYGTTENFRECYKRGIRGHMGVLEERGAGKGSREGIYGEDKFIYDEMTDTYRCPAGEILKRRNYRADRKAYEYGASGKVCGICRLRTQCTRAKTTGRTVKRYEDHKKIMAAKAQSHSAEAKRDKKKRTWFMEGSFADAATRHGFKRARWRRLRNQQIQDYVIAVIQNIRTLIRNITERPRLVAMQRVENIPWTSGATMLFYQLSRFIGGLSLQIIRSV